MWWWWSVLACSDDGWRGAPPVPARLPDEVWTLALHGHPVGVERVWRDGTASVRRRTLVVDADGERVERRTALATEGAGPITTFLTWSPEGATRGAGPAWLATSPPPLGEVPMLDSAGAVAPAMVSADPDGLTIVGSHGRTRVRLEDGRTPVEVRWAGTRALRVATDVADPEPLDVAAILRLPAPSFPSARRSLVGVYRVGGVEVRVDAPSPEELPAEAVDRLRALVGAVDDEIPDGAAPFGASGGAGDCTEHAVRFVALAREQGFEARTAAGRLVVDEPEPGLVLHAWAEVRVGAGWLAVDPALRQVPADAGHLRLGTWMDEVAASDGVSVEVLDLR